VKYITLDKRFYFTFGNKKRIINCGFEIEIDLFIKHLEDMTMPNIILVNTNVGLIRTMDNPANEWVMSIDDGAYYLVID